MSKLRINSFKSDPTGWIGSSVMLVFSAIAVWRWSHAGLIFFALTGLRDLLAAWFLLIRNPNRVAGRNNFASLLAYASSALPLMYLSPSASTSPITETVAICLAIVGYALATLALIELGPSFGISAANREKVTSGVYHWISHPMYLGYVIAESGAVVLDSRNLYLFALSAVLYVFRASLESSSREIRPRLHL